MTSLHSFKIDKKYLSELSKNEQKILPFLIEAARRIHKIFILQADDNYEMGNLYPHETSKVEIEEAAKENPAILSPFTLVEKNTSGELVAVDYHVKYSKELKVISDQLLKAASICENNSFKKYLEIASHSLITGEYEKIDIAWLGIKGTNVAMTIGPYERYLDKMFFIKRGYQATVGVIDKDKTKKAKIIRDVIYTTIGGKPHRLIPPSAVDVEVQQNILISGLISKIFLSQQHLPSESELTEKYGSKIIGYVSTIDYKFEKLIYPIFNIIFEKKFKASYKKDLLKNGNYYYVLLTALVQQLHRYRGSRSRLREVFPVFDEANSVVSGIQHSKHLVLKGVINQKELEAIMICAICWIFSEWVISKETNAREDYLKGDALILNFLRREGAVQEKEGISWPNFAKMFFEMENLSDIFTRILEEGTYTEAHEFLTRYMSYEPLVDFSSRLAKIKSI